MNANMLTGSELNLGPKGTSRPSSQMVARVKDVLLVFRVMRSRVPPLPPRFKHLLSQEWVNCKKRKRLQK